MAPVPRCPPAPEHPKPRRGTPTRPDGSCGAAGGHSVVQERCMLREQSPRRGGVPFCSPSAKGTLREGGRAAVPVPCEHQCIPQGELSTGGAVGWAKWGATGAPLESHPPQSRDDFQLAAGWPCVWASKFGLSGECAPTALVPGWCHP